MFLNGATPQNTSSSTLHISAIEISLAKDPRRTIRSIKLKKNNESLRDVLNPRCRDGAHRIEFSPPLALNAEELISVSVNTPGRWKRADISNIDIKLCDVVCSMPGDQGVRSYRKEANNVVVVITGRQPVLATITPMIEFCSRFRILLVGNSGVGKSSLVSTVFGVEGVHVSENIQGLADIDREFISPVDERFVIHDSLGFEAGDEQNMEIVKNFVERRMVMPQLEDQLHAIWVCLETPYAGGRLFEGGVEKFLQRRIEFLGQIPLVVVFTKVDRLDLQLELDLPANENRELYKSKYLDKFCLGPLRQAAGSDVPYVTVSVEDGYFESLSNLVNATHENVVKYVRKNSRP